MTQYVINIGAVPNDGTGDPLRTAFNEVNLNFNQVWATGLIGSNLAIANNTILTTNTNGNLVLNPNGVGVVQANAHVVPDRTRARNLGSPSLYWDTVYAWYGEIPSANIGNASTIAIDIGNLHISGGTNGYVLQTDGTGNLTWTAQTGGSGNGVPGGANTQVQYNDAGAFGGQAGFTFDNSSNVLSVPGNITTASGWTLGTDGNLTVPGNTFNVTYANSSFVTLNPVGNSGAVQFNWQGSFSNQGGTPGDTYSTLQFDGDGLFNINGTLAYQPRVDYTPYITVNTPRVESEDFGVVAGPGMTVVGYDDTYNTPRSAYLSVQDQATATQQWDFGILGNGSNNYSISDRTSGNVWTFGTDGNITLPSNIASINYANGAPYGGSGSAGAAGNAGDIQINVAGNIGADSTLRYVDNGGEMTLYADYLNAPGVFTSDIYAGNGSPSNITLTTSYGNASWTFGTDGSLQVPSNALNPSPGIIASANGYPTLLAYGSGGGFGIHGGPELDWMNADDPANTFGNVNVIRNTMYINGNGLYIGINENRVIGNASPSWSFRPDGNLTLPSGGYIGAADVKGQGTMLTGGTGNITSVTSYYADAPGIYSTCLTANPDGTLNITTYGNGTGQLGQWTFDAANLTLPNGATIKDTSGDSVAFGQNAGNTSQQRNAVAIGSQAGREYQGEDSIAIGAGAGYYNQGRGVAIGYHAGFGTQDYTTVSDANGGSGPAHTYVSGDGNPSLVLDSVTDVITYNQYVTGNNIPAYTYVTNIYPGEDRIDISQAPTAALSPGDAITFIGSNIGVASTSGLVAGARVLGTSIPDNTYINSIIGPNNIDISQRPSAPLVDAAALNFYIGQGNYATAVGYGAGTQYQDSDAVAVGYNAGTNHQGASTVAVGVQAGAYSQSTNAVAVGASAGAQTQGINTVAVGYRTGGNVQGNSAVAIGEDAGYNTQGANSVAIGSAAGFNMQGAKAISIGLNAGRENQGTAAIAMGWTAGYTTQGIRAVAIGEDAGYTTQGNAAVALGLQAGYDTQGANAVAIGYGAGLSAQGNVSVAIGMNAGQSQQGTAAVAMGWNAGQGGQGNAAVAIGEDAGKTGQGAYSIAIGYYAGFNSQANNTIVLNATGSYLTAQTANTFVVAPVRSSTLNDYSLDTGNVLYYNTSTHEITTAPLNNITGDPFAASIFDSTGNVTVWTASSDQIVGAKLTVRVVYGTSGWQNTEMLDITAAKNYPDGTPAFTVSNRVKTNPAYSNTLIDVTLTGGNVMQVISSAPDGVGNSVYWTCSATSFNQTFD